MGLKLYAPFSANGLYALDYPTLTYRQIGTDAPTEIGASIDGSLAWYCGGSTGFGCLRTSDMSKIWSDTSGGDSWAAFWPDDSRILLNGNLTVRSTTDFGVQATWGAHQAELYPQLGGVSGVAQSPSAGFLASSGVDCLKFWDPSTGELTRTVTSADGAFCMAVSPDASLVATGSAYPKWGGSGDGVVSLWNASDGSLVRSMPLFGSLSNIFGVAFSPDGQTLYTCAVDRDNYWKAKAVRVSDGTQIWSNKLGYEQFADLYMCLSLDGSTLVVCSDDDSANCNTLFALKAATGATVWSELPGGVQACALSPDGKTVFIAYTVTLSSGVAQYLAEYQTSNGSFVRRAAIAYAGGLALSPDGQTLSFGDTNGNLVFLRAADLTTLATFADGAAADGDSIAYSSDGKNMICGTFLGDVIYALNPYYVPLTPVSVSVTPTPITGPSATGKVTIAYPAPYGGAIVTLSSSNSAAATVPSTVTVPQGATTVGFPVANTNFGTTNLSTTIQATLSGTSQTTVVQVDPIVVKGTVTLGDYTGSDSAVSVTVAVRTPGTTTALETHTVNLAADGTFAVPTRLVGTYDVAVKGSHWLRRVIKNVAITSTGSSGLSCSQINGDVNGDNTVNLADLMAISAAWRSTPGSSSWNPNADLNGDGAVNLADWMIAARNWRVSGDP